MSNTTNTVTKLQSCTASITDNIDKLNDIVYFVSEIVNDLINHFIPETTQLIKFLEKYKDIDSVKKLKSLALYLPDGKQYEQLISVLDDLQSEIERQEEGEF